MFPAMYTVRDINADVQVCRQHEMFYREERGSFSDPTILAVQRANEQKPADFEPSRSKEDGRTVDDLLSIVRMYGSVPKRSNKRYAAKLTQFGIRHAKRREKNSEKENSALACLDLRVRMLCLEELYRERRRHHFRLFKEAAQSNILAIWLAKQQHKIDERIRFAKMASEMRAARAAEAAERKRLRDAAKPPKWKKYIDPLYLLPIGESITLEADGGPNFGKRLRTQMSNGSTRLHRWHFKTKTIGDQVTVLKVGEFYSSIQ